MMHFIDRNWMRIAMSLLAMSLVLGLIQVWSNLERMGLAYDPEQLARELARTHALVEKLEVERDNLLSPNRLRSLAREYGFEPVQPGQVRRLEGGPHSSQAVNQAGEPKHQKE